MANSLRRDIEPGEIVVMDQELFLRQRPPEERAFVCRSGPGMQREGRQTAIVGTWMATGTPGRVDGDWISDEALTTVREYGMLTTNEAADATDTKAA